MDEALKKFENDFFAWLPSFLPPHSMEEIKNSYKFVNSMLLQRKVISRPLIVTTQIDQIENVMKQVKRVFASKKLRDNATKLLAVYLAYLQEINNAKPTQISVAEAEVQEDWIRFDFTNALSFERTFPAYCNVDGAVIEGRNWARILVAVVEHELANENPALEILYEKSLYTSKADRPFLMKERIDGLNCSELSNSYWINVNWSIPRLMEIIQTFCLHCGYNKEQVVLYGTPKKCTSIKHDSSSAKKAADRNLDIEKVETYLRDAGLQGATVKELIDAVQPGTAVWPTKKQVGWKYECNCHAWKSICSCGLLCRFG